jgi:hypothetical protein
MSIVQVSAHLGLVDHGLHHHPAGRTLALHPLLKHVPLRRDKVPRTVYFSNMFLCGEIRYRHRDFSSLKLKGIPVVS